MTTRDHIIATALGMFARGGFLATSLQQIADQAGTSKASILYHFASKEALLDAALAPSIAQLIDLTPKLSAVANEPGIDQRPFVRAFVEVLDRNQDAVSIFISQRGALTDVPIIERGNQMIQEIADACVARDATDLDRVRFAVGLAGAAFIFSDLTIQHDTIDEFSKVDVMTDLLMEFLTPKGR